MRPELQVLNPLWIMNIQPNIVINFHQDFEATMHTDFFQGQTDMGPILLA
jgi:hypothetical protein